MESREDEGKLLWQTMLNVWLWHRYPDLEIDDMTALVAMMRLKRWLDWAIAILEGEESIKE